MHFLPFSSIGFFPLISEHWLLYHKPNFLLTLLSSWISPLLTIKPLEWCLYTCCVLPLLTRYSYPVPYPQFSQCSDETFPHRSALLKPMLPLGSHLLWPFVLSVTPSLSIFSPPLASRFCCSQLSFCISDLFFSDFSSPLKINVAPGFHLYHSWCDSVFSPFASSSIVMSLTLTALQKL